MAELLVFFTRALMRHRMVRIMNINFKHLSCTLYPGAAKWFVAYGRGAKCSKDKRGEKPLPPLTFIDEETDMCRGAMCG